ncbi:MAG: PilZ domain-containing protein, partial [Planctomycetota bacterium]|nr:PilZ domain-containing protein [Planctomycetota bacterium]
GKNRAIFKPLSQDCEVQGSSDSETMARVKGALDAIENVPGSDTDSVQKLAIKLNQYDTFDFLSARKQPRRHMISLCRISYLVGPSLNVCGVDGCIRNISAGGLGLVVGRAMIRGELVEVCISQTDEPLYAAGLVAFCRHIEGDMHEIGVQLISNDSKPIISENPLQAINRLNWVARAVQDRYGEDSARRKSA